MEHRKALMIDLTTGAPVDPNWTPTLHRDELDPANDLMAKNALQYRWRWIPATAALDGIATLHAA
jgi:hypothetical protein